MDVPRTAEWFDGVMAGIKAVSSTVLGSRCCHSEDLAARYEAGTVLLHCAKCGKVTLKIPVMRRQTVEAFIDALNTIKHLHGAIGWDLYFEHSPEMQRYRKELAALFLVLEADAELLNMIDRLPEKP